MADLADELAMLTRDLKATLASYQARGLRMEAVDAPVPEATEADAAWEADLPELPDEEAEEDAIAAPPPAVAGKWDAVAQTARETRTPTHHDDGQGSEGLDAVRADLGDCTRCGLCEGRTQIVFGVGDAEADLMVIGEGPGQQEDAQGEPFVGKAGQMLDKMLENVLGLPRSSVYIANIVKCRPPNNRNPEPAEAAACLPFLHRQIAAVQPRYILLLGSVALLHLLDERGITRKRGRELAFQGIPVMPTLHPAYLLRKPEDKRLVFEDLKQVRARYDALGGRR